MEHIEYLGFSGTTYLIGDMYCIDVCDMASQVLTVGGSSLEELKLNLYLAVDNLYSLYK